jgi:Ca2+/H+ antiporter, TMEM165/GDT1 family
VLVDFVVPLVAIGLAEFGDKTQLAVLLLASRTERHGRLFMGVMTGFLLVDGLAVFLGSVSTGFVPVRTIKTIAGGIFILFGVLSLRGGRDEDADANTEISKPFTSGLLFIAISEMGDKTQIAAGLFAAEYNPMIVLAGTMVALAVLSLMAIYSGRYLIGRVNKKTLETLAGVMFVLLGLGTLFLS